MFHSHEDLVEAYGINGATAELVRLADTLWCGKVGYATNNVDEPDVERIFADYMKLDRSRVKGRFEPSRDTCVSIGYLADNRPSGVVFGELVESGDQPEGFDVLRIPAASYIRLRICPETAKALGREMWRGGIPPYEWVYDVAPRLGLEPDVTLPIIEYYGHSSPETHEQLCYLYAPVKPDVK